MSWFSRFRGRVMSAKVPPLIREAPDGYFAAPVTELMPWEGVPPKALDGSTREIVGRPTVGHWPTISAALWPRPDPSKRWRLFIQEDTRP